VELFEEEEEQKKKKRRRRMMMTRRSKFSIPLEVWNRDHSVNVNCQG
jgi:hypothetical protein